MCLDGVQVGVAEVQYSQAGEPELSLSMLSELDAAADPGSVLKSMLSQHAVQKKRCINVLAADSYQLIQTEIGDLPASERRDAARWQIRERIDYPVEEAVVDLFEIASFGGDRKPLTYAVSAPKSRLLQQVQVMESCGLNLVAIDIPEFALRNICELFSDDQRGVAVLLLLEESGILAIAREGTLYLARLFNTGMDDLLPYADGQYEMLTERLDAIVLEVQRSFDFCESTFLLPTVSRLLVAQTGREIPALINYFDEYLTTQVESLSFDGRLKVPDSADQLVLNRNLLAIGGALRQELN